MILMLNVSNVDLMYDFVIFVSRVIYWRFRNLKWVIWYGSFLGRVLLGSGLSTSLVIFGARI